MIFSSGMILQIDSTEYSVCNYSLSEKFYFSLNNLELFKSNLIFL